MARRDKLLCVVAAALSGALLGLAGAPAVPDLPPPTPARETAEPAPLRRTVIEGPPAPAPSVAERTRAPRARPDLPSDVRLCWSPTARRLLGEKVHGHLESLGARVRACTES
ncbi:MAG TPA: hypothetical protein VK081_05390, partial [Planctomycetota bacterium]|nr:hypothetical protein [Planctomycetota bacterium]